jgi:branched-chain amino acid transport system ATP-binding protein
MLSVKNLHVSYGGIKALRGVNLHVDQGEVVAVLGANGAGKSTLLKAVSAMLQGEGEIRFKGKKIPSSSYKLVKEGLMHVPEGRRILANMTVLENLQLGAFSRTDRHGVAEDIERALTLFPRLRERLHHYGGLLSGGEQQMLAISRGLMSRPDLIMLDEPSLGLAPIIVKQIFDIIGEISSRGTSILLVEQNAFKALSVCGRAYILSVGEVVQEGSSAELLNNQTLIQSYLG